MDQLTEGLLLGTSLFVLFIFSIGMTAKIIGEWAQKKLDKIHAEENQQHSQAINGLFMDKITGDQVTITYAESSPFGSVTEVLHNVTNIHYNYVGVDGVRRTAFESGVHLTGKTVESDWIDCFDTLPELKIADAF